MERLVKMEEPSSEALEANNVKYTNNETNVQEWF